MGLGLMVKVLRLHLKRRGVLPRRDLFAWSYGLFIWSVHMTCSYDYRYDSVY
jgi:hypothetical protein